MIRIAQVLNKMNTGGIESIVTDYYKCIDKEKVQFDFYYNKNSNMPLYDELKKMGAGLYPVPSMTHVFSYFKTIYAAFKKRDYHIVHAQVNSLAFFPLFAAKCAGVRVRIAHSHTVSNLTEGKLKAAAKDMLRPLCKMVATHCFACGNLAGKWMFGEVGFKEVINARDLEKYKYSPKYRKEIRDEFNIPQDAFVIGTIGRNCPEKNQKFLLEVQKYLPNSYVIFAGAETDIRELSGERVIQAGNRTDAYKIYSALDAFCLPSFKEGLPLVIPEAQANGLKCFISDAITRQCDAKENAIFLSLDAKQWAQEICNAIRDNEPMPIEWDIHHAAKELQNWYLDNYDYVSAYVRNKDVGPACYYRVTQYAQPNWKLNNAYSKKQYQNNFDLPSGIVKKVYQAYLMPIIILNRIKQLRYDLKYKPSHIIIQRELIPHISLKLTNKYLEKLSESSIIYWDFDDDIRLRNECSVREFNLLNQISTKIIVTNEHLKNLVVKKDKVILMPTTVASLNVEKNKAQGEKLNVIWVGSWSGLENLDLVGEIPEEAELTVVCNLPYSKGRFVKWTREAANEELMKADVGIMPLVDKPYSLGKGAFKIIQYMSAGLPVIASPVGFNKEVVTEDFGFLTDNFKMAIKKLCKDRDLCRTMGQKAREKYEECFSYDNNYKNWKELCSK